jgi:hypothetical protein
MSARLVGEEAFKITLPVHESAALREHIGDVLVPTLRLSDGGEDLVRNLALSVDGSALVIRVQTESAPPGTYTVDLAELANFVALVHGARARVEEARREADDDPPPPERVRLN